MTDETETFEPQFMPQALEMLIKMAQVEVLRQQVGPGQEIVFLKLHTPMMTFTIPLAEESVARLVNELRGLEGSSRIVIPRGNIAV